jgi:hypothetical protein
MVTRDGIYKSRNLINPPTKKLASLPIFSMEAFWAVTASQANLPRGLTNPTSSSHPVDLFELE